MKITIRRWFHGLFGGVIGGSATAGTSWLAMAGAKSAGMDVPDLNWKALGVILVSGAVTSALAYLKQSPLPPVEDDEPTISKSVLPMLLIGALCLSPLTVTGCKTPQATPAVTVGFRTLETTQILVDKAMKVYGGLCARGKVTVEKQKEIDDYHAIYRESFRMAVIAAQFNYGAVTPDNVQSIVNELIQSISKL